MLSKKKLVKWVKPGPAVGWAYYPGDKARIDAKKADKLIKDGYCLEVPTAPDKKETTKKSGQPAKKSTTKGKK